MKLGTQVGKVGISGHRKPSGKEMQVLAGGSWTYMQCSCKSKVMWAGTGQGLDKVSYKMPLYILTQLVYAFEFHPIIPQKNKIMANESCFDYEPS